MNKVLYALRFEKFAEESRGLNSRLYELLSREIAEDEQLLELSSKARSGQPIPNLLFAAVHYLLLEGKDHPLREFYPSITANPWPVDKAFNYFKDFCSTYEYEIIPLLKNKLVQTNEIRRCAYLYPVYCWIYNKVKKPLSLIEIGTSAGLQLLWDQYSYSYGSENVYGNKLSDVHLHAEIKGNHQPTLLLDSPPVASKIGVDLNINDLRKAEDYLWLKALIWPEHHNRREMFDKAVSLFKENPVDLIEGDGVDLIPTIVAGIKKESVICIFHTHVANQMPEDLKHKLLVNIDKIGQTRDVFHIYNNMWDEKLHVDSIVQGKKSIQTIGMTDGHGRWFEWDIT